MTDRFVIGLSENVEAEYSFRSNQPVTLLTLTDDEVTCIEGFPTIDRAKADLKANDIPSSVIEYVQGV